MAYGAKITFNNQEIHLGVVKSLFGPGINSFALIKQDGRVMNERAFFINHQDQLNINLITPSDTILSKGDSISVKIKVTDKNNQPVQGVFSLAVTDNSQVKKDAINDENILSYFLLSADLKGRVETPGYYFSDTSMDKQKALDALILTQGFIKYNWDTTKMTISAEPEFEVSGKVSDAFNKPIKQGNIVLIGKGKQTIIKDTVTDNYGNFIFNNFPLFDTSVFFVQARNKKNKEGMLGIALNDYDFPTINTYQHYEALSPNLNIDTTLQKRIVKYGVYNLKKYGEGYLPDVIVTTNARVDGSENLNGPGQYDEAILKNQLEKMKDSTLLDILKKRLNIYVGSCNHIRYYMLNGARIKFIFDGVVLDFFYDQETESATNDPYLNFLTKYLKYYTAKDIKGIEVMQSGKYASKYFNSYLTVAEKMDYNPVRFCPYAFIEITTYRKNGPFVKHNATADLYRPVPFSYGKISYQPKYVDRQLQDSLPDIRSTIFWHPEIVTDKSGEANVYFSSAASSANYTMWIEGIDMNGHLGYSFKTVKAVDNL